MLTFQNLYDGRKLKQFLEASKTFPQPVQKYLQNLELRNITEQVSCGYSRNKVSLKQILLQTERNKLHHFYK